MRGLGSQDLGSSNTGLGQADAVRPLPSFRQGARYIGTDGNPVIDPVNGGFMKADSVSMRVYFAVKTTIGSAGANVKLGVKWPKKIDARFEAELVAAVLKGLVSLTSTKQIRVDGVTVEYPQPERYTVSVDYLNMITQKHDRISLNGSV